MQPVPAEELSQVSGGSHLVSLGSINVVVAPVTQLNFAVLSANLLQSNLALLR